MTWSKLLPSGLRIAAGLLIVGCTGPATPEPYEGFESPQYADLDNWLCHPDLAEANDVCDSADLAATIVEADGSTMIEEHMPATAPKVDCFYVYPTVSLDDAPNSDLEPSEEETFITIQHAARFNSMCRVFAPMYRQITLTALLGDLEADRDLAYGDVFDAFKHYMANFNDGRGVLLLGHSQGSGHLRRLLQEQIETDPVLGDRLIGAYLIGSHVEVPNGEVVGGTFEHTPLCESADQTGCVIGYRSYRETEPPEPNPDDPLDPNMEDACTHPAALAHGGPAVLEPYLPQSLPGIFERFVDSGPGAFSDPEQSDAITTPFFVMPEFIEAECVRKNDLHYLEIRILADPDDPRADDIGGDFQEGWGLHVIDVHLALGDLIGLAKRQAQVWLDR